MKKPTKEPEAMRKTTVWVPPSLWDRLSAAATAEFKSTSSLLRDIVAEGLHKREKRS